jgi:hypothetical protein
MDNHSNLISGKGNKELGLSENPIPQLFGLRQQLNKEY